MSKKHKALTVTSSVLVTTLCFTIFTSCDRNNDIEKPPEQKIVEKVSIQKVSSQFTPVAIYRLTTDGAGYFAGCGSLFTGGSGEQIITAEHLLLEEFGSTFLGFRKLRPVESEITHGISLILHKSEALALHPNETPDVVILKTGVTNLIQCYSKHKLIETGDSGSILNVAVRCAVRSLVSGESTRVVGVIKSSHDSGTTYALLEYNGFNGESGTGFVDELDQLYVLKGTLHDQKGVIAKHLGTTKKLSMAYGPFKFRDK